ncbi:DUF397 domain-containing protein [Phytomonospora endophytica]|uniref:DUF397 domain-containing protein n=1 Tax=Phytomonospora endophytica TaxID=714109 RepID=A0A841FNG5_9ACTN|nr:DUF397 domain-containing protein [Phytomonospora endophytica]MBB6037646.1 hypothetical protein [Phytomonospora endophytica]GIG67827.1 hypothetical protein Pen01_41220 [Phytomonospora endophytica]
MTPQDLSSVRWVKSSRSTNNGTCVEVASWRKSSRSNGSSACVEVASSTPSILVRDSKDLSGPVLTVTPSNWVSFLTTLPS